MAKKIYSLVSGNLEPIPNGESVDFDADGIELLVSSTPLNLNTAVSKGYVDGLLSGLEIKESVKAATTTELLNITTAGSGIGKTVSGAGSVYTALSVDSYTVQLNDRVLLKDQTTQSDNGIYELTTLGVVDGAAEQTNITFPAGSSITPGEFVSFETAGSSQASYHLYFEVDGSAVGDPGTTPNPILVNILSVDTANDVAFKVDAALAIAAIGDLTVNHTAPSTVTLTNNFNGDANDVASNNPFIIGGISKITDGVDDTQWVLTRVTDADQGTEVNQGMYVFVEQGTVNSDNGYTLVVNVTDVDVDPQIFTLFSSAGQITAGQGLLKTGPQLDLQVNPSEFTFSSNALTLEYGAVTSRAINPSALGDGLQGGAGAPVGIDLLNDGTLIVDDTGIRAGVMSASNLGTDSVTTVKIQDDAVTLDKLANDSVSEFQILNSALGDGLTGGSGTVLSVDSTVLREADIVDNLTSTSITEPLSANQGKVLEDTKAPLASPTFTGTVTIPTPVNGTDATTKDYVDNLVAGAASTTSEAFKLSAGDISNGYVTLSQLPSDIDSIQVFIRGAGLQFNKAMTDSLAGEQGDFVFYNDGGTDYRIYFRNVGSAAADNLTEDLSFIFIEDAVLGVYYSV